jgi:hypothetical protein
MTRGGGGIGEASGGAVGGADVTGARPRGAVKIVTSSSSDRSPTDGTGARCTSLQGEGKRLGVGRRRFT